MRVIGQATSGVVALASGGVSPRTKTLADSSSAARGTKRQCAAGGETMAPQAP